jgi:hypothetical protein
VGQVRLLRAQSARRLTARPAESEHPATEINHFQEQQRIQKELFKNADKKTDLLRIVIKLFLYRDIE